MARAKRKRGDLQQIENNSGRLVKKKPIDDDEDILSDEAGEASDGAEISLSEKSDGEFSEPEGETAEERRLRLARAYLRRVGISEDAAVGPDGTTPTNKGDGSDEDADNTLLQEQVLGESGRFVTRLAERVRGALSNVTLSRGKGHVLTPTCVSLARDEPAVAVSGGKDSRVIIWDVPTGKGKAMFRPKLDCTAKLVDPSNVDGHIGSVDCVTIVDDGKIVASGGADGLVRVWDVRSPHPVSAMRGHRGPIRGLALRAGSRQLFSASEDRTVKIWDLAEMAYVETLFGHGGEVNAVDTMISERVVSSGRDGTVRLYKVIEGTQLLFRSAKTMSIDAVAIINEQRFISGGDDGAVCLWQLNKKKPTAVADHAHGTGLGCDAWVSCVCSFRNSDLVVSGGGDGKIRFWKCEDVPKLINVGDISVGPGFVNGLAVSRGYDMLAVAVGNEHRLGRWTRVRGAKNTVQFLKLPVPDN